MYTLFLILPGDALDRCGPALALPSACGPSNWKDHGLHRGTCVFRCLRNADGRHQYSFQSDLQIAPQHRKILYRSLNRWRIYEGKRAVDAWLEHQYIMPLTDQEPRPPAGGKSPDARTKAAAQEYVFSEQVGHLLRRAYQRHVAIFQQTISDSHLTAAQFVVLCAVRQFGSCSLSEIVKVTAIDQATMRGIISRLKTRKVIKLSHDEHDRRKVMVSLTAAGASILDETVPAAFAVSEATFGNLNPAERVAIVYLLRKMCELEE